MRDAFAALRPGLRISIMPWQIAIKSSGRGGLGYIELTKYFRVFNPRERHAAAVVDLVDNANESTSYRHVTFPLPKLISVCNVPSHGLAVAFCSGRMAVQAVTSDADCFSRNVSHRNVSAVTRSLRWQTSFARCMSCVFDSFCDVRSMACQHSLQEVFCTFRGRPFAAHLLEFLSEGKSPRRKP